MKISDCSIKRGVTLLEKLLYFPREVFFITASTHCGDPYEYWLNGNDTDDSGSFMWIDSQTLTIYTNWYTNTSEPNSSAEKCVVTSTGYHGVWNDIDCKRLRPVVCERNT